MKRTAIIIAAAATLGGCSTELDLNAPYKDITVVYGLLNMRDSVHYVKVNKAYLGEGDAYVYAQIPDSNEWDTTALTSAKVYRLENGTRTASFDLTETTVSDREPGIFYSPDQKLYTFRETFTDEILQNGVPVTVYLNQNWEYELEIVVKGQTTSARTTVVNDFSFSAPDQSLTNGVNLVTTNGYGAFELNWNSNRDGKRYVVDYRFNYKEVRGTDTTDLLSFTQRMGTVVSTNSNDSEPMSVILDGLLFYNTVATVIPNDPTVDKRIFLGLDFIVSVANDEFHTFLTLSEPISGIIEDRPSYSNVTNGYGIFAGRYTKNIFGKSLGGLSMQELVDGDITANLRFCTGLPADVNSPYYCP